MNRRSLLIILIFLLVIASALLIAWLIYFVDGARSEIIAIKKGIAEIEKKEANIKKLEDLMASLLPEEQKISTAFVDSKNLVLFIEELESAARDAGIKLEISSAELSAGDAEAYPIFQLSVEGSFGQNFRFLQLLETLSYQLEITDATFALRSMEGAGSYWQTRASISLLSFINK